MFAGRPSILFFLCFFFQVRCRVALARSLPDLGCFFFLLSPSTKSVCDGTRHVFNALMLPSFAGSFRPGRPESLFRFSFPSLSFLVPVPSFCCVAPANWPPPFLLFIDNQRQICALRPPPSVCPPFFFFFSKEPAILAVPWIPRHDSLPFPSRCTASYLDRSRYRILWCRPSASLEPIFYHSPLPPRSGTYANFLLSELPLSTPLWDFFCLSGPAQGPRARLFSLPFIRFRLFLQPR